MLPVINPYINLPDTNIKYLENIQFNKASYSNSYPGYKKRILVGGRLPIGIFPNLGEIPSIGLLKVN
jgi:hypothetical protein